MLWRLNLFAPILSILVALCGVNSANGCTDIYDGFGPLRLHPAAEYKYGSFYQTAYEFSSKFGAAYTELVKSRLSPTGKTTLVIAMGGAEHLGTLLEILLAELIRSQRIEIKYIPLGREVVRPWRAFKIHSGAAKERVGIGAIPDGYEMTRDPYTQKVENGSDPDALKTYLDSWKIFESQKVLVIDTGTRGSIPEAVFQISKLAHYPKPVEGLMLYQMKSIETDVKIYTLSGLMPPLQSEDFNYWAAAFDFNNARGVSNGVTSAFPRSAQTLNDDEMLIHYQETLQGFKDGLAAGTY